MENDSLYRISPSCELLFVAKAKRTHLSLIRSSFANGFSRCRCAWKCIRKYKSVCGKQLLESALDISFPKIVIT